MARKCKCRLCGKELTTDKAFCVKVNEKNTYYCSRDEYDKLLEKAKAKEECNNYISSLMGTPFVIPALAKLVNKLNDYYDYSIIQRAFKDNSDKIQWALNNKSFNSEFAKSKYIMSIVLNNINKSYKDYLREQEELKKLFNQVNTNSVDVEILNFDRNEVKTKQSSDISMFLED